jgi:outer membrane protein assembly factor BamB
MDQPTNLDSHKYRPLRILVPVLLVALMGIARYFSVWFPEIPFVWMVGAFVPALLSILILLWWLFFSRAWWLERVVGCLGVMAAITVSVMWMDKTMLGPPIVVLTLPSTLAVFALTLATLSRMLSFRRTLVAIATSFLMAGFSTLLQNDGATGDFGFGFDWRWKPTPEQIFLSSRDSDSNPTAASRPTAESFANPEWPGFRGLNRDGIFHGSKIESDWNLSPPKEIWRVALGPAWSSFAVADPFLVTQEQRGEMEAIVCYDANTGREVWSHEIQSRFFDALGGLGPRATPTLANNSVFALGAEGLLIRLAPTDGTAIWKVDLRELTQQPPPMWGFSCSPLVVDDLVIVHAAGPGNHGIIAFDSETGTVRWSVAADKDSYSSLHRTDFFGQVQVVFVGSHGVTFLDPSNGSTLLEHEFKISGYRAVQPAVVDTNRLLFTSESAGSRLIQLSMTDGKLEAEVIWTSRGIKPDFNDLVVHDGFIYGFDGAIFVCVDLQDGSRRWRKGRYGKGQALLLADSGLLLVISEQGKLIVLEANPEEHREIASIEALNGKTWNHPVVVGDRLYLRNANEAVCYQLPSRDPQPETND